VDDFAKRLIKGGWQFSEVFSLNDKPDANFRLDIWGYSCILLYCQKIGQTGELKLVSKFWFEGGGNKFCERVNTVVFEGSGSSTEIF